MLDHIEGFGHVSHAAEDFSIISKKVINCFRYQPCAHNCGAPFLIAELEIIKTKTTTKQQQDDPINNLQDETTDGYASVVLVRINA